MDITAPAPTLPHVHQRARTKVTMVAFTATSLLGSALLFLVQPLVARLLLPHAGGSASLWNTAMVFFQVALLGGYLFAHVSTRFLGVRRHLAVQVGLLLVPLAVLPLAVPDGVSLTGPRPALATLAVLTVMVGPPFFALATASPTLQRWFAETDHPHAANPYFLYAAGNIGSIGALLGYPLVLEPRLGLSAQTRLFTGLYVVLVALTATCALLVRAAGRHQLGDVEMGPAVGWPQRVRWIGLAAVPSALLLGVTRHLATDVASFPLLWAIPLTLYLLTYVLAFSGDARRRLGTTSLVVRLGVIAVAVSFLGQSLIWQLVTHLGWFFAAALLAHLRLAADRPPAGRLTEFYAWLSVGGAAGGALTTLVAPMVFDRVWEYPIAIVCAVALAVVPKSHRGHWSAWLVVVPLLVAGGVLRTGPQVQLAGVLLLLAAVVAYLGLRRPLALAATVGAVMVILTTVTSSTVLLRDRSFFGSYQVLRTDEGWHQLVMGTTLHGQQQPGAPLAAASYYHPDGPLGDVFSAPGRPALEVGIIGLGAGEIAAYGRPGDAMTFYEIDPVVADIALDPRYFTFLNESPAGVDIEIGDGRIALAETARTYDTVVVDAFSSDAIPVHLLTTEAVDVYLDRVGDGLVLLHISNRHFDLAPVLGRIARDSGLTGRVQHYTPTATERESGASKSIWVALSRSEAAGRLPPDWVELPVSGRLWTDDYSDLLSVVKL